MPSGPLFSVVVPTRSRAQRVRECLAALSTLRFEPERFEVIIVDDASDPPLRWDEIEPVAGRLGITLLTRPTCGGSGAARNDGAARARGQFLAFTADDCAPQADWLSTLAARLDERPDCLIGGAIVNALPTSPCATASHLLIEYLYSYYNRDPGAAKFFTPNNMAVPTRLFQAIGGFDVRTGPTGEDRDFCHRWRAAGHRMIFAPDVVVRHAHPLDFTGFCRQQYSYGVGSCRYRKLLAQRQPQPLPKPVPASTPEPLGFYWNLVAYPLRRSLAPRAWLHAGLLGVSQVANAAGVMCERLRRDPPAPRGDAQEASAGV